MVKVQEGPAPGGRWWFSQWRVQDETVLTLHSPADAAIGHYRLSVSVMSAGGNVVELVEKVQFHLLFNPWCKGESRSSKQQPHVCPG